MVKGLTTEEQDHFMAYIYKGLAHPEAGNSAVLLAWHEKVCGRSMTKMQEENDKLIYRFLHSSPRSRALDPSCE